MNNIYGCFFDCHVVRACEIKYTSEGLAIGNFSIAVNDSVKRNGEWCEEASFFECVCYGKIAETLKTYVTSGQRMFFLMRPKQERWVDKEGKKRSRVVFVVNDFSFGEKPRGAQPNPPMQSSSQQGNSVPYQQPASQDQIAQQQQQYASQTMSEEIPFNDDNIVF